MVNIFFFMASVLITLSYVFYDILLLRLTSILGSIGFLIGALIAGHDKPGMISIICFNIINILVNGFQFTKILLERKPILLPDNLKDMYYQNFYMMKPADFLKLYKLSSEYTIQKGELLLTQGQHSKHLILIRQGAASVNKNGVLVATLEAGAFVGEMSFLTGGLASASITVESDGLPYIAWDKEQLQNLKQNDVIQQALALDLIKKINLQEQES